MVFFSGAREGTRARRRYSPHGLPWIVLAIVAMGLGTASPGSRLVLSAAQPQAVGPSETSAEALAQIGALLAEKASRTPAQRKLDSQLVYAVKMARGEAITAAVAQLDVNLGEETDTGQLIVDASATVSDELLQQLRAMNVDILASSVEYNSLRLGVEVGQLEAIAALPQVIFIQPKQQATTARVSRGDATTSAPIGTDRPVAQPSVRKRFDRAAFAAALRGAQEPGPTLVPINTGQGSQSSEADQTHRAFAARGTFHTDGTGVKIGVLSDDVCSLAASQALGDLGPVTVLPGQTGSCPGGDEGTAMLELIHDLAPGAQLYFATAFTSITSFAQNIRDLRTAGCDIIVDDVLYFVETPFQDGQSGGVISTTNAGVVIQAVKDVTAAGALYFSSGGNYGSFDIGSSGTWEGDFVDGGAIASPLPSPVTARVHDFGPQNFNTMSASGNVNNLYWADPLGASSNDYDLFRLDSTGAMVLAASTNIQSGTQDPYEQVTPGAAGDRLVIVKSAAAAGRFLHVSTSGGRFSTAVTAGATHGHAAVNSLTAFGVAATPAVGPFPNAFSATDLVEFFNSDGPRRIFFQHDGAAITPGNLTSTGGQVLNKPDITAADGTSVTGVGGFAVPFFGTSAAAPHAAAIAALVKAANPALTAAQIRTALVSSAIDIHAAGVDRNSGAGIIMAYGALQAAGVTGTAFLAKEATVTLDNPGNGDGGVVAGEGGRIFITLMNLGVNPASAISATLTSSTPGITVHLPNTRAYPAIPPTNGTGANGTAFTFTVASNAPCPPAATFTLTMTYTGGGSPAATSFTVPMGPIHTITTTLDGVGPPALFGIATATGLQTGRLNRNGIVSTCAAPKTNPGLFIASGLRQYDSFTFNTCPGSVASCATVTVTPNPLAAGNNIFTTAYVPSFVPSNPSTNYKADPGGSSGTTPRVYSFPVSAGAGTFAVAVHELASGGGLGTQYTLNVTGACAGACATPNQVPVALAHNVYVTTGGGSATASINNGSFDPDGDPFTLTQSPAPPYPIGTTAVLLTVTDPKGATSQVTRSVSVTTSTFTDNPLVAGATSIKAAHITELRTRIDSLRAAHGLPGFSWTDLSLTPGSVVVKAVHITQLRMALSDVYTAAGLPLPAYDTDPALAAGAVVKAFHLSEIRANLLAIE